MSDSRWRKLRVATYNIHRCRGLDGRTNPARIANVIRAIDADIVALQEVIGAGPSAGGHAEELGALLGMGWVMAPTRHLRGNLFGNVVLSRHPILHHAHYDLSWKTCEPRGCQRVDVAIGTDTLHLYNVHLGTAFLERRHQAERLGSIVHARRVGVPKVVLGDFNEWSRGLATKVLNERLESIDLRAHLMVIERSLISQALQRSGGTVAHAARLLSLRRTTLVEKLRKLGMAADPEHA